MKKNLATLSGFTLVELMVCITIMTTLLSVVIFNYGTFKDRLALSSAGQELAIAIRQAQTYGLNVKEVTVGGGQFSSAYGIYFNPSSSGSNEYILFADTNPSGAPTNQRYRYDAGNGCGGTPTECVQRFTFRDGITMRNNAAPNYGICDAVSCHSTPSVRGMHITFIRPNPDASINFTNSSNNLVGGASVTGKVVLVSPKGNSLTVIVENTGQVYVQ